MSLYYLCTKYLSAVLFAFYLYGELSEVSDYRIFEWNLSAIGGARMRVYAFQEVVAYG